MTASVIIAAAVAMAAAQPEGTRVTDPAHWAEVSAEALTGWPSSRRTNRKTCSS